MTKERSEYIKQWKIDNKDRVAIISSLYNKNRYIKNMEKIKEKNKTWKKNNNDRVIKYNKEYRIINKEKIRKYLLRKFYNITTIQYNNMIVNQDGKCAICDNNFSQNNIPHVDHNHKTGKVRQLLCKKCNSVLGMVDENKKILNNAIGYLEKHEAENGCNAGTSSDTSKGVSDQSVQVYFGSIGD